MATKKVTITLPKETLERVAKLARAKGVPLSTYIADMAEHRVRIEDGLAAMREWEAEYGPFTADELADAESRIELAEKLRATSEALAS